MKKAPKIEYGITITKPWSKEMYDHNELVAAIVRNEVEARWIAALMEFEKDFESAEDGVTANDIMLNTAWHWASEEMVRIQKAITYYSFTNQSVEEVAEEVVETLENMPTYQLKELVEELELQLETGFIGFNS